MLDEAGRVVILVQVNSTEPNVILSVFSEATVSMLLVLSHLNPLRNVWTENKTMIKCNGQTLLHLYNTSAHV